MKNWQNAAARFYRRSGLAAMLVTGVFHAYGQRANIHTEDAATLGLGRVKAGTGVAFFSKHDSPAPGFPVSEWRILASSLRVGVADNVDFGLEWRGGLVADLDAGQRVADWGDVQVLTKMHILGESESSPGISMLQAVKLPSTRYIPTRLGSNQTDFSFRLLFSKSWNRFEIHGNAGFAILGSPSVAGYQDDLFLGSFAISRTWTEHTRSFLEVYGFTGNHLSNRKTVIRSGIAVTSGTGYEWSLFGSVRVTGDSDDFGTAFESSENWSVGVFVERVFEL